MVARCTRSSTRAPTTLAAGSLGSVGGAPTGRCSKPASAADDGGGGRRREPRARALRARRHGDGELAVDGRGRRRRTCGTCGEHQREMREDGSALLMEGLLSHTLTRTAARNGQALEPTGKGSGATWRGFRNASKCAAVWRCLSRAAGTRPSARPTPEPPMTNRALELSGDPPEPGESIAGKYVVEAPCGRGGLAVVLRRSTRGSIVGSPSRCSCRSGPESRRSSALFAGRAHRHAHQERARGTRLRRGDPR